MRVAQDYIGCGAEGEVISSGEDVNAMREGALPAYNLLEGS